MSRTTVIVYHGIGDFPLADDPHELYVPVETFEQQMEFLARHRRVVPLEHALDPRSKVRRPAVAITFDDGYRSVLDTAGPILGRLGLPATVFVPTRWIGDRNEWDQPYPSPLPIMTADELLEVEKMGITVESHGHSHIDFSQASEEEAAADLARSIDILQEILGRRPRYFAYPWGRNSARARELVAQAGFEAAWSIEQPGLGNHARERVCIRRFHGLRVFSLKTTGRWGAFRWSRTGRATASIVRPLFFRRPH